MERAWNSSHRMARGATKNGVRSIAISTGRQPRDSLAHARKRRQICERARTRHGAARRSRVYVRLYSIYVHVNVCGIARRTCGGSLCRTLAYADAKYTEMKNASTATLYISGVRWCWCSAKNESDKDRRCERWLVAYKSRPGLSLAAACTVPAAWNPLRERDIGPSGHTAHIAGQAKFCCLTSPPPPPPACACSPQCMHTQAQKQLSPVFISLVFRALSSARCARVHDVSPWKWRMRPSGVARFCDGRPS